jgi:hypothetical protein
MEAHEEPKRINRSKFRAIFHAHHVSQGVIKLKKEFQDLKYGSMSVNKYITKFLGMVSKALLLLNDGLAYALEA